MRTTITLLATLTAAASVAAADPGGAAEAHRHDGLMDHHGTMGGHAMRGLPPTAGPKDRPWLSVILARRRELGLSPEQVGKLYELREGFEQTAEAKAREIREAEQALDDLLGPEPADLARIEEAVRKAESLRAELRLARFRAIEEGKQVLSAEQRRRLAEMVQAPSTEGGAISLGGPVPGQR
jgi:Spy/CpxP family protein refolding chaperone